MRVDFDCLVVWIVDLKLYALCFNETYCRFAYMWLLAVVENNIRIIIKTLSLDHETWHTVRRISKHILRFEGSTFGSKDHETYPSTKDSILRAKIGSFDIFRPSLSNGLGPFLWYVLYTWMHVSRQLFQKKTLVPLCVCDGIADPFSVRRSRSVIQIFPVSVWCCLC